MDDKPSVFNRTYKGYLAQLAAIDLSSVAGRLGGSLIGDAIGIPLYGEWYTISGSGITDIDGKEPTLDVSVILAKYILLCPSVEPSGGDWVSYRDFKDSGPLTVYFAHDVEQAIAGHFGGRLGDLRSACKILGGSPPNIYLSNDLSIQFDALPRVQVLLIYDDADDEFPASASVLFDSRAEKYLDPESLAMLGRLLFVRLKGAAGFQMNS